MVLVAVAVWSATFPVRGFRELRRPSAYFIVAVVFATGLVGLLKILTNVHCLRALADFGGTLPYLHLFSHRSELMQRLQCSRSLTRAWATRSSRSTSCGSPRQPNPVEFLVRKALLFESRSRTPR